MKLAREIEYLHSSLWGESFPYQRELSSALLGFVREPFVSLQDGQGPGQEDRQHLC